MSGLFLSKEARFVQSIRSGDRMAEREFFDYCYSYCMNAQSGNAFFSKDRFQDAFLQIWTEIQDGRIFLNKGNIWRQPKAKGAVAAPMSCSLRSFIVDICNKQGSKESRVPFVVISASEREICGDDLTGFERMDEEERLRIIHSCIGEMSRHCREILTLFYVKGLSLEQIMKKRNEHVSKDGLKTSKSKCMQRLRDSVLTTYISLQ
ncbi:MAG: sigma-70 family RNA polymerase sigma factor [Bacteroidales bacterium]|nr:sigma-70 family RNA polymerase sigma factor [Bacteroidales bacterium]